MSRVERFSQSARRTLAAAQEEAEALRNTTVDTPHILLAMLRVDNSVAYRVLKDLKIDYEKVQTVVRGANPAEPTPPTTIDLAPETRRLLEAAMQISQKRGDRDIGSEHLLLALVRGEDKSIRYVMRQINLEPQVVRTCVERVLQQGDEPEAPTATPPADEETVKVAAEPPKEEPKEIPQPSARMKVLQMVEAGKISPAEAAELLKAMRFAAVPVPGDSAFVLLPLDEVNFDKLREHSLRFVMTAKGSDELKAEVSLSFDQAQSELFRLLRALYTGSPGAILDLEGEKDHLQISLK